MNIYLDESYNLQKERGKLFISINGFSVLHATRLRKRWKQIRRPYTAHKRRIHAADPYFEDLREKSITLLKKHDITLASVFQLIQEIPHTYFSTEKINFELVYTELLKRLCTELALTEYRNVRIIIDARKHPGGTLGAERFQQDMRTFLTQTFPDTTCTFLPTPSYIDILVELADFVSNTFYRAYHQENAAIFDTLEHKLIQIKNPL